MDAEVVLGPGDEGGFTVYVPPFPGCISEGNAKEAILLFLDVVEDDLVLPDVATVEKVAL